tara:strand:+ start:39864 stop:40109 length:246 start_codon:yes stop_codon:yes gene_type:complete
MEFAIYSVALVLGYAMARYITEQTSFHVRLKGIWLHHWILAALAMAVLYALEIQSGEVWGLLTGVALEGLSRKNWSIKEKK